MQARSLTVFSRFVRSTAGVAMLEFALVVPVLLILFCGIVEVSRYYLFREKLDTAATQVLDIITQNTNVDRTSLNNLYEALPSLLTPYTAGTPRVIVTQIMRPADPAPGSECGAEAVWQYPTGGSRVAAGAGSAANLGSIQLTSADNVMSLEVFATYTPLIDNALTRHWVGRQSEYVVAYGHTRYGSFNMDPNTGRAITTTCGSPVAPARGAQPAPQPQPEPAQVPIEDQPWWNGIFW